MLQNIEKKIFLEVRRYFIIAIKKLMTTPINKEKLVEIEQKQKLIKNEIQSLKNTGLDFSVEVEKLNAKYIKLELEKPQIDWTTLCFKCCEKMKENYPEQNLFLIKTITNKIKDRYIDKSFSLEYFRRFHNISSNKSYYKMKEEKGIITMTGKEKALKTAAKKREKSTKIFNEVLEILSKNETKISSTNIYEIIKNDFDNCISLRQVQRYLKEFKSSK